MKTNRVVQAVAAACALSLMLIMTAAVSAEITEKQKSRLDESAAVLTEIHAAPDKDIPQELWDRATCVIVVPSVKKAAFVFGGEYGKGLMSCRKGGAWSAPLFMQLQKGSWGLQIGAQSIDLVLLVNNERGMKKLLGNKVTLGAEASVAAGPVGRDARAQPRCADGLVRAFAAGRLLEGVAVDRLPRHGQPRPT